MKLADSAPVVVVATAALVWLLVEPRATSAYTISSRFTADCHEKLTSEALRTVRATLPTAAPLAITADERALVEDLEYVPEGDMADLGGATLIISVRDNDLKGRASDDLTQLAQVHGNPDNQDEHCLRSRTQDEPGGSQAAVASCRAFIRGRVLEALDGLDAAGAPDLGKRTNLALHLALRGDVTPALPTYYVRIGQAIHAVEDSFTHTYRTPDGMQITTAMNWIDEADGRYSEARDGPAHASKMDACDDADLLRTSRRQLATEAAVALLQTTLDPQKTRDAKVATVDVLLDKYLTYAPGCTFDNNWCDAPEREYKNQNATAFGCNAGGDGGLAALGALLCLAIVTRRRKLTSVVMTAVLVAGVVALAPGLAQGAPARAATGPVDEHAPPPPVVVAVPEPGPIDPTEAAWGGYLGVSGSVDNAAAAIQLGVRRKMSRHWTLGWDVEWNRWIAWAGPTRITAGTLNTYGTVIFRLPLAYEDFNLRTTVGLGVSYLLFDLYGAPKGSIGLYGAVSPLGIEWKLSRLFVLVVSPISISVPVPQLKGVPLTYPQYRFNIGLAVLAG